MLAFLLVSTFPSQIRPKACDTLSLSMAVLHHNQIDPRAIQPANIRSGAVKAGAAKVLSDL